MRKPDRRDPEEYPEVRTDGPGRSLAGSGVNHEKVHTCKYVSESPLGLYL